MRLNEMIMIEKEESKLEGISEAILNIAKNLKSDGVDINYTTNAIESLNIMYEGRLPY